VRALRDGETSCGYSWSPVTRRLGTMKLSIECQEAAAGKLYGDSESRRFQSRTNMAYSRGGQPKPNREEQRSGSRNGQRGCRSYIPPKKKTGFRKELNGERKAVAPRYYQLLTGHALIVPFLKEKLKKTDSDRRRWCETGKRQPETPLQRVHGRLKSTCYRQP